MLINAFTYILVQHWYLQCQQLRKVEDLCSTSLKVFPYLLQQIISSEDKPGEGTNLLIKRKMREIYKLVLMQSA